MMRDPAFWWSERSFAALLLRPAALWYGAVAASRMRKQGTRIGIPVICIGNLTLGGAGKTPAAIAVARLLGEAGERPFFLTRGYGGRLEGPVKVNPATHRASDVGDEPLLLARHHPTIVAHDRVAGAKLCEEQGASVVIMDDGLQNPSLTKDVSVAVVDARRGLGNGLSFPAGPLRAPLPTQLEHIDAMLLIGERAQKAAPALDAARARGIPVLQARLQPDAATIKALGRRKVLAFAGIGDPEKFFSTLAVAGIEAVGEESFPDHHRYSAEDAQRLVARAESGGLLLVTTEKDFVRFTGDEALAKLAARTKSLPVTLEFQDENAVRRLLKQKTAKRG